MRNCNRVFARRLASAALVIFSLAAQAGPVRPFSESRLALPPGEISLQDAIEQVKAERPILEDAAFSLSQGLAPEFDDKGADCEDFIQPDGQPGKRGKYILDTLNARSDLEASLIGDEAAATSSMRVLCPGFRDFDKLDGSQRKMFQVWTLAAIAWVESTCGADKRTMRGMGGAVGLLQLDPDRSHRSWRGPLCDVPSVRSDKANLACGLEIMRGLYNGEYGEPRGIAPVSYWKRLRQRPDPRRNEVMRLIHLFPGCQKRRS
jgi:hypothetical protein